MAELNLRNIGVYNWHKTTEELPPVGCYVLGYLGNRDEPRMLICKLDKDFPNESVQYFFGIQTLQDEYSKHYWIDEITHWMHLPNAPAQEETE